jgi:amino acid permease
MNVDFLIELFIYQPYILALETAGPGSTLIAIVVNGVVAISIMKCVNKFTC